MPTTQELRVRRAAKRQGLELMKVSRRDPRALDFGRYFVVNPRCAVTLDEAEADLAGGSSARRTSPRG